MADKIVFSQMPSAHASAKFTSHAELRNVLLDTGDQEIVENAPADYFFGGAVNLVAGKTCWANSRWRPGVRCSLQSSANVLFVR